MASDLATVEETVKRLSSHKGVLGVLVINGDGVPIRSTLEHELSFQVRCQSPLQGGLMPPGPQPACSLSATILVPA